MTRFIRNTEDVIDSRDIIARLDDLQEDYDNAQIDAVEKCLACGVEIDEYPTQWLHPETSQPFCSQACAVAPEEDWKGEVADLAPDKKPDGYPIYLSYLFDEEAYDEWKALKDLNDEAEGYGDWKYGETLIRRSYWKEYVQQFAEDIGAIKSDAGWPHTCINWDDAADELEQDYTSVDFAGTEYLMRS